MEPSGAATSAGGPTVSAVSASCGASLEAHSREALANVTCSAPRTSM